MKKSRLKQIIKEEISKVLNKESDEIVSRGIEYGINPEIDPMEEIKTPVLVDIWHAYHGDYGSGDIYKVIVNLS